MTDSNKKKHMGTEEQFELLHGLVTSEFITRIQTGDASTADLKAAADWLSKNNVTGVAAEGSPLAGLAGLIPELTFDDVQKHT